MTDYTALENEVDAQADVIWDMASHVWEFAELGYRELESSAYESEVLEKSGFKISDRGIGGCETSWIATWGSAHRFSDSWWSSTHSLVWATTRCRSRRLPRVAIQVATVVVTT